MCRFEAETAAQGFARIAGVDEAGRGPLAGPIVAGAVVLAEPLGGLNDSKQLSEPERERLYHALQEGGHAVGMGVVTAEEIDRFGIQSANYQAMARAVAALPAAPDFVLVDGFKVAGVAWPQARIIKGDCRSVSIAAASVAAKVTRDRMMMELDEAFPGYGFARNKGYGTREHLEALRRLGPCPAHRRSFAPLANATITGTLFQ